MFICRFSDVNEMFVCWGIKSQQKHHVYQHVCIFWWDNIPVSFGTTSKSKACTFHGHVLPWYYVFLHAKKYVRFVTNKVWDIYGKLHIWSPELKMHGDLAMLVNLLKVKCQSRVASPSCILILYFSVLQPSKWIEMHKCRYF